MREKRSRKSIEENFYNILNKENEDRRKLERKRG